MKKTITVLVLLAVALPHLVYAGFLVQGAKITRVTNMDSSQDIFVVKTTGGSGPCAELLISFPINRAVNQKTLDRAVAIALTAMTSDFYVDIYNYSDSACTGASYIEMYKQP